MAGENECVCVCGGGYEIFACDTIIKWSIAAVVVVLQVLEVVQEQVSRALQVQPTSFEAFRVKMGQLSYSEIMKIWEVDRQSREEMESQAVPIVWVSAQTHYCVFTCLY